MTPAYFKLLHIRARRRSFVDLKPLCTFVDSPPVKTNFRSYFCLPCPLPDVLNFSLFLLFIIKHNWVVGCFILYNFFSLSNNGWLFVSHNRKLVRSVSPFDERDSEFCIKFFTCVLTHYSK